MSTIAGVDPRTGIDLKPVGNVTTTSEVDQLVRAAGAAAPVLVSAGRSGRADFLEEIAAIIDQRRVELIAVAQTETGFADAKLNGEINRSAFQFRFFADVLREGSYLEATLDTAGDTPMGPQPDLRRMLVPLGPVAVFGASNFPFAFSVLGGDTASALAAGSPVVVKAHGSHPATSKLSYEILVQAVGSSGLADGTVGIVFGTQGGAELVAHPLIKAVGFTGSLSGGRALLDIIDSRPEPIPFYGELSSLNPVVITQGAAEQRAEDIGAGLVASFTVGAGQLCTKPGFVLVPRGSDGDRLVEAARRAVIDAPSQVLLNRRIFDTYIEETDALDGHGNTSSTKAVSDGERAGFSVDAMFFETDVEQLSDDLVGEIFGPVTVIVRYDADALAATVDKVLAALPSSLTATLHTGDDESDTAVVVTRIVSEHAGRIVYNGFPTGVSVSWAQTHGGPWPSTNSLHTSVGATAIRRFLRPLTFQNAPEEVLPVELRDDYTAIPRRIDGKLQLP